MSQSVETMIAFTMLHAARAGIRPLCPPSLSTSLVSYKELMKELRTETELRCYD